MGQSRGGALANLIAKRVGDSGSTVFGYTFESPATVDADSASGDYDYIHNYLCSDDIVTMVPMWDMTRYGNTYELKTEETDNGLAEELDKLGSEAAGADVSDVEDTEEELIKALEDRVQTRAEYSEIRTDKFTNVDTGEEVSITYSYQDMFVNLMSVIFGGELTTGTAMAILDDIDSLSAAVYALAEAVELEDAGDAATGDAYYWKAAKQLHEILNKAAETEISLSDKDVYALLKLIGPIGIDSEYEPTEEIYTDTFSYIEPLLTVAMSAVSMTYSHQFDTLIARLKVLAPQPELDDVDIEIADPKAGDDLDKACSEVINFFDQDEYKDANNQAWLTATASWDTNDQVLQDNCVYYLDVSLEAVGHLIPEDLELSLNGKAPVKGPEISYEEATGVTRATWEFAIGDPADMKISFDTAGMTDQPEAITVKNGTALSTKEAPDLGETVTLDGATYRFDGWYSEDGIAWDDLKVFENTTMYAKWYLVVSEIEISFDIPAIGETIPEPKIPEDAPYYISEYYVTDERYDEVTVIPEEGECHLSLRIELKDPEHSEFSLEKDKWGYYDFTGTATVNGEEIDLYYDVDEEGVYLRADYDFTPSAKTTPAAMEYTFTEGDGQSWVKGSEDGAQFVVKCSTDDEKTFDRFTGIQVDGTAVDGSDYTAEAGSVIITLNPSYLETLSVGEHTLTALFEEGSSASATFDIVENAVTPTDADSDTADQSGVSPGSGSDSGNSVTTKTTTNTVQKTTTDTKTSGADSPDTGDDGHMILWFAVMCVSLAVILSVMRKRKQEN